ncbi:MAG: hypothetical protein HYT15_04260 [Candidatus Magasanikbacteria bacterium]|nr:hypothetical protein [Candidatus Magasanikbacteria bacterium]
MTSTPRREYRPYEFPEVLRLRERAKGLEFSELLQQYLFERDRLTSEGGDPDNSNCVFIREDEDNLMLSRQYQWCQVLKEEMSRRGMLADIVEKGGIVNAESLLRYKCWW